MSAFRALDGAVFDLMLDVNQPGISQDVGVYRTGKYTGEMGQEVGAMLEGWRLEGQIWTEGKTVVGRFTKVFPPAGAKDINGRPAPREVPVCIILGNPGWHGYPKDPGSKPGAVILPRAVAARFIWGEWTQP